MSRVTVRQATPSDIPPIIDLAERGWTAAYGGFLPSDTIAAAMTEWYDPADTREAVLDDDVAYFVAELDETVRGYVSGSHHETARGAMLSALYVDPDCWGNGIGTGLLEAFEKWCRDQGYMEVHFQVLQENDIGYSFYRKHGYEVVSERTTELFGEPVGVYIFRGQL